MSINPTGELVVEKVDHDTEFDYVFQIRQFVFVEEYEIGQEDDYDGFDHLAHHYLAWLDGEPIATARWRRTQTGGRYRIERIAVLKDFRRNQVGTSLVYHILKDIPRDKEIFVHAPVDQIPFFASLNFEETGFEFEEAGINHKKLVYVGD